MALPLIILRNISLELMTWVASMPLFFDRFLIVSYCFLVYLNDSVIEAIYMYCNYRLDMSIMLNLKVAVKQ